MQIARRCVQHVPHNISHVLRLAGQPMIDRVELCEAASAIELHTTVDLQAIQVLACCCQRLPRVYCGNAADRLCGIECIQVLIGLDVPTKQDDRG